MTAFTRASIGFEAGSSSGRIGRKEPCGKNTLMADRMARVR